MASDVHKQISEISESRTLSSNSHQVASDQGSHMRNHLCSCCNAQRPITCSACFYKLNVIIAYILQNMLG